MFGRVRPAPCRLQKERQHLNSARLEEGRYTPHFVTNILGCRKPLLRPRTTSNPKKHPSPQRRRMAGSPPISKAGKSASASVPLLEFIKNLCQCVIACLRRTV